MTCERQDSRLTREVSDDVDPKKIREIARVCATLSKSAPTAEEHDIFANLASKWLSIALDRETRLAIDLDHFADDGGAPSVSIAAEGPSYRRYPSGMAIGKQKARERWDSNPRYGYPYNGFRVLKFACWWRLFWFAGQHDRISADRKASGTANDRQIESRDRKMHERTLAVLAKHFVIRLTSRYRAIADELAWRRAANRGRSNRAWEWIVGAVFVIAIILTGYSSVQTQQHLETRQSELENAKQATDQAKAQASELAKRAASLNSELEKANAQRNELQTKLDQATSEITSAQSQLEGKQSRLEGMQGELENANQATDQAKAQATELAKRVASLNSELEKANAQRNELQTKLEQATSEIKSAQSQLEDKQSRLGGAERT